MYLYRKQERVSFGSNRAGWHMTGNSNQTKKKKQSTVFNKIQYVLEKFMVFPSVYEYNKNNFLAAARIRRGSAWLYVKVGTFIIFCVLPI